MQFTAPGHQERVGVAGVVDAQRDIGQHLFREAVAQVARGHVLAVATRKRRRVDLEIHRQRRLVDHDRRQRLGRIDRSERRADREFVDAGDEHDVAGLRGLDRRALDSGEREASARPSPSAQPARRRAVRSIRRPPVRPRGGRGGSGRCRAARRSSNNRARQSGTAAAGRGRPPEWARARGSFRTAGACRRLRRAECTLATLTSSVAQPFNADAYTTGKSSCSSVAPIRSKSSNVWLTTHSGRAPGRSTLFTTTIGARPSFSAFSVTKRVCGIGPSTASTSSRTPSTIPSTRSTSPPKSAWPGVSTMLMWVSP